MISVLALLELTIMVQMITIVMNVLTNVRNVLDMIITVTNVQKIEYKKLIVYAHQEP